MMTRHRKEMILSQNLTPNGYCIIELNKNKVSRRHLIHRLVYDNFIGDLIKGKLIHHKDENKKNNHYFNLEQISFITHNNIHKHEAWNKGLKGFRIGEKRDPNWYNGVRKKVKCVETGEVFDSVNLAAFAVGLKANSISRALHNNKYRAGKYHYEIIKDAM